MSNSQNTVPVNRTKLYQPSVTADYVPRENLEARLEQNSGLTLTVVSAPAGYGKSTLISHWLNSSDTPSAWVSLDENDSEVRVFLTYLVAALHSVVAEACKETSAVIQADTLPPLTTIVTQLCNDLDDLDRRVILVLDDFHRIGESDVSQVFDSLLQYPSQNILFVIITRPLSWRRLSTTRCLQTQSKSCRVTPKAGQ